jgi:hypothetical protein
MERWYRFSVGDRKPLYGRGTMDQALEYADRVKHRHNSICTTSALLDEEAQKLGLEDNTEAFALTQALADAYY